MNGFTRSAHAATNSPFFRTERRRRLFAPSHWRRASGDFAASHSASVIARPGTVVGSTVQPASPRSSAGGSPPRRRSPVLTTTRRRRGRTLLPVQVGEALPAAELQHHPLGRRLRGVEHVRDKRALSNSGRHGASCEELAFLVPP